MIINNKQPKTTPAFSSENAFNNNRSIYLRLLVWLPALFIAGRRIHGNERFREPTDPPDRDEIRLFPRGSDAICRAHRTHEFPRPENRPHNGISCILLHRPFWTPFYIPAIKYETPSSHRSRHRLPLRLHRRIPPALCPGPRRAVYRRTDRLLWVRSRNAYLYN